MAQTFIIPGSITATGKIVKTVRTRWAGLSDDIVFEANHSPVDMMHTPTVANWVEQPLLVGKPRMAKIAVKLQEIKITCRFHFSIRPFAKIKLALANAAANGTVLQWVFGTGEALGDFVLTSWEEKYVWTDEEGLLIATDIDLVLKEYAGPGVAEQTGIDARKKAFANKPQGIITPPPTMVLTSQTLMSQNIQTINNQSKKILTSREKLQKAKISLQKAKSEFIAAAGKIKKAVNNIDSAVAIARNIKNANSISSAAALVGVAANSLELAAGQNPTVDTISSLANDVSFTAGSLDQASQGALVVKNWFPTLGR